jgi:hypothetical protein
MAKEKVSSCIYARSGLLQGAGRVRIVAYTTVWSADRGSSVILPETALRGWLKQPL